MCNGGAAGLLLAATQVVADPSKQVLVTTGDRFTLPGFDRWASDYAVAYGDGATSALVHRYRAGHDPLQLLSLTMATAPEMERMHRGEDAFTDAARTLGVTVDVRRAKRAFLATGGMEQFREVSRVKIREVIDQALTEAGIEGSDPRIKTVLLPRLGPSTLDMTYLPIVEDIFKARAVSLGEQTGHLGAGDFLANLQDLVESPDLHPDELAIVLGGGGGFTWTCAVVRKALISKGELS
jgi:3-oxoacyl-[acyl-carrier-protein] synthase-3